MEDVRSYLASKRFNSLWGILSLSLVLWVGLPEASGAQDRGQTFINSLGMRMVNIPAGSFVMGTDERLPGYLRMGDSHYQDGDFDERPYHRVKISRSFYMSSTEVTNAEYERFDPDHRELRGKLGFSSGDDEAVVFVSWHEAAAFTEWLSKKEGRPYRLPTEAEWEYACRAGTRSAFHTGDALPSDFHKNVGATWYPIRDLDRELPSLTVGKTPANPWGLFDMHGNVEEWCYDWYGPYELGEETDPVGRAEGDFRVTRGGSHSTELYYLRSANRSGALPEDKSWVIGFRVVMAELPAAQPRPVPEVQLFQQDVRKTVPADLAKGPDPDKPYFKGPRRYVKIPPDSYGPRFSIHNHDPAIVECPNGDLLAIWYSCVKEPGREVALLASRLRYGAEEWEPASLFWDAPDRNDHAPALWFDGNKTIYHFSGVSVADTYGPLALIMRTSTDNGVTWSKARLIDPEHGPRRMPIESVFRMSDGTIVLPSDAPNSASTVWLSEDEGQSWVEPGGSIAGIHAGVVQLKDGRLMALGRGNDVDGKMPKSISSDRGKTWNVTASPFPPISGGQRLVLIRLKEGPLFFASFAREIEITDVSGTKRRVSGLFAALSEDEGETWDIRRLISDDGPGRYLVGGAWTLRFLMSHSTAEPRGYMSVCQTADGVIHLISSAQHYAFNLAWLKTPAPSEPVIDD